jgi:hypothetical protein
MNIQDFLLGLILGLLVAAIVLNRAIAALRDKKIKIDLLVAHNNKLTIRNSEIIGELEKLSGLLPNLEKPTKPALNWTTIEVRGDLLTNDQAQKIVDQEVTWR